MNNANADENNASKRALPPISPVNGMFKMPLIEPQRKARRIANASSKGVVTNTNCGSSATRSSKTPSSDYEALIARVLAKPFKCPVPDYVADTHGSNRCLGLKRSIVHRPLHDPYACNALVLWSPPESPVKSLALSNSHSRGVMIGGSSKPQTQPVAVHVVVDPVVGNILRPHQREGVRFMYDCVTGARSEDFRGCIMADEMGLGKTLQCITLLWTLLRQSPDCKPAIIKAIIVCPSSLVKNWHNEFGKWLGTRVNALALDSSESKEQTTRQLEQFMANQSRRSGSPVLVLSYETFRVYAAVLCASEVGLLLCDEGHRLKNCDNLTYTALMGLQTRRRVLLSGTPIQNDLTEYYSLVNFVNPGMLGTRSDFKRTYENCILRGQDANATADERSKAAARLSDLTQIVNQCLIRRTNSILTKYLPVKFEMVICVRMSELQTRLYQSFLASDSIVKSVLGRSEIKASLTALSNITALKKLCNHPDLIYEKIVDRSDGFENAVEYLPSNYNIK